MELFYESLGFSARSSCDFLVHIYGPTLQRPWRSLQLGASPFTPLPPPFRPAVESGKDRGAKLHCGQGVTTIGHERGLHSHLPSHHPNGSSHFCTAIHGSQGREWIREYQKWLGVGLRSSADTAIELQSDMSDKTFDQ